MKGRKFDRVTSIVLNGQFTTQTKSGVQRFASEIAYALDRQHASGEKSYQMFAPAGGILTAPFSSVVFRTVGRLHGQAWEQVELPQYVGKSLLVNLGNTAPLLVRRQIVVIHDAGAFVNPEAYSLRFRLWYKGLQRLLAVRKARLVSVSRFACSEVSRHIGVPELDVALVGEAGEHILRETLDDTILRQHGLQPGRFVLAVGNLTAHKNLRALGLAAARLAARGITLVVVGGTGSAAFAADAALPEPAIYTGKISDGELRALYEAAACFVFPSRYEGFGLPPLEAMACGCPVVASTAPAVVETCGDAAWFCDPDDHAGFADAVCRLLDEPELRATMRRRGLDHAASMTWDKAAGALTRVIDEFCDESRSIDRDQQRSARNRIDHSPV